jgi:hypothetical protein
LLEAGRWGDRRKLIAPLPAVPGLNSNERQEHADDAIDLDCRAP